MRNPLDYLFPGYRWARKILKASPHLSPWRFLWAPAPGPLENLPEADVKRINQSSRTYYDREDLKDFWFRKPYSDVRWAGQFLGRFGQLLCALNIQSGDKILDYGCGSGWTSIMMARMGAEVVGTDIAPAVLQIAEFSANQTMPAPDRERVRFENFPENRIPYPDEHFDSVVIFEAYHHLPNPKTIMNEIYRVLSPNGLFVYAEPGTAHKESELAQSEMEQGILEQDLDLESLYRTGMEAGFQNMEVFLPFIEPHLISLPMKRARWYLRGFSRFVPSYLIRAAILSAPAGVFIKGPHRITSLHPHSHIARIRTEMRTLIAKPDSVVKIEVEVHNPSDTVWLKNGRRGRGFVRLGAQLLDQQLNIVNQDFGRAPLKNDMTKNSTMTIAIDLKAPSTPGNYIVRLDMVNEGICWFASQGSPALEIPFLSQTGSSTETAQTY